MVVTRLHARLAVLGAALACCASFAAAQPRTTQSLGARFLETRVNLEALARSADSARKPAEAALLRARLRDGDFQEADKIILLYETGPLAVVAETLTVRPGRMVEIPKYGELSLVGVLHSELREKIGTHLARFFTQANVRTTPLMQLAVQGSVGKPGYYYVNPDAPLPDAVMAAGGQTGDADWPKTIVRRAGVVIWKAQDVQWAVGEGLSVDRMQLRGGDEIFINKKPTNNAMTWIQLGLGVVTLVITLSRLR